MKKIRVIWPLCLLVILIAGSGLAQDDETRQASGLPMRIGETNPNRMNLSGRIMLEGFDSSQPKPTIFVLAMANGLLVERRRANDNGTYFVPNIPRNNVMVTVEINGQEVDRQQLLPSTIGNMRQDFIINAAQWRKSVPKSGVISAPAVYARSAKNEQLFEKATAAAEDKKTDQAIKLFQQIVDNDPKDFVAWTDFGTLYFRHQKYSEAEKCYIAALEQKPDYKLALLNLSRLYLTQKQPEKIISLLTPKVEADPASADLNHYLGEAYLQIKKGSKAIIYLNEAIRLAPLEKAELHLRLAGLYNAAGIKDKAVEEYKLFLEKVPNHPEKEKIEKYIKDNSPQ